MFDFHSPRGSVMHAGFLLYCLYCRKEKLWKRKVMEKESCDWGKRL